MKSCRAHLYKHMFPAVMLFALVVLPLWAAGAELPGSDLDFSEAAVKRGEAVYKRLCQTCHSLKYLGYQARMTSENARAAFGKTPPDLDLMAMARGRGSEGAQYIYALLVSYNDTPEKNSLFPNITMPPLLSKGDPESAREGRDVAAFLAYTADPSAAERRALGRYVLGYMLFLTGLLYLLNRETWGRIKNKPS